MRDANLPRAAARLAGRRRRAGLRALAGAARALDLRRQLEIDRVSGDRLLERELELVAQIGPTEHLVATAATAGAEDVAEHLSEQVAERVAGREPARAALGTAEARVTEPVVRRALVPVRQNLVGLLALLEARLGLGIARIAVGVMFHRKAPIRLLDVRLGGVLGHPQNFVVVAL